MIIICTLSIKVISFIPQTEFEHGTFYPAVERILEITRREQKKK